VDWVNALIQGILLGGLYALLATGLSLVFGVMRVVNLAQGDLTILAAFLAASIVDATQINPLLALVVVVPAMMILGYALQRGVLNFALSGNVLLPILITFGIGVILQNALLTVYTADSRGLDAGSIEGSSLQLTDQLAVGWFPLVTLVVAILILVGLQLLIGRTQLGRAFRATADDPAAARLVGINDRHVYALAMALALGTVAVAGVFLGIRTTFGPLDGPVRLIFAFEAVVIGGLGSLWGTLAGGIILGVAQTFGNQVSPAYQLLAGHLVFLVVLVVRPGGLFPSAAIRQTT
jgi:branched-chain amino acid transport system permease protein